MTPYASIALFKDGNRVGYSTPRKEIPEDETNARKAAMRYWNGKGSVKNTQLKTVFVAREVAGMIHISERSPDQRRWTKYAMDAASITSPHLRALLAELGVDPERVEPPVPDVLIINGYTYRRDI